MASLVQVEAQRLLDNDLGTSNATAAPTTPLKIALLTTASSSTATGTEVTGGGYARQTATFGASTAGSGGAAGQAVASNSAAVSFTNMPDTTANSVKAIDIWENGGRRIQFGALATAKTTGAGDTLQFAIGAIALQLG